MSDVEIDDRPDGVREVRLNRPERLNALTPDMVAAITTAMQVERHHRAVVVTGVGRGFCAGVDINGANERQKGRSLADGLVLQEIFAGMILSVTRTPVPVVCAINGPVAGAGLALALSSDIRIAARPARFIIGAPNIGLSAGECGISYFLPRLVGGGRAAEIMLTNRHVASDEALAIGLITRLVEMDGLTAATDDVLESLLALSPFGQRMTKKAYRSSWDAQSLEAALDLENRTQIMANSTEDAAEARAAFLGKRKPVWTGR